MKTIKLLLTIEYDETQATTEAIRDLVERKIVLEPFPIISCETSIEWED